MSMYKEYRFPTPDQAIRKQREIKKAFGYKPEIYVIQPNPKTKDTFFSIVHPEGLVPVNRKDKVFQF